MPRWYGHEMLLAAALLWGCASETAAPEPVAHERAATEAPALDAPALRPVETLLYPAELVMDHQAALGLTAAQSGAIRDALQRTQHELVDAELSLRAHREALIEALSSAQVDEEAVMGAAAQVADDERAIKLAHLRLLVQIKNELNQDQQQALERMRAPAE